MGFWRKEFTEQEIEHVLDQVKSFRVYSEDGKVSLQGGDNVDKWTAFLVSAVGFDVRTDALKTRVVKSALFSPDLKLDFTKRDFQGVVYRLRRKYQSEEIRPYKVVFPLWNIPTFLKGVRKIGDVSINFSPSSQTRLFRTIMRKREEQRSDRSYATLFTKDRAHELQQCSICIIHTRANNQIDAHERASQALYEILGLINLAKDGSKYWRMSSRIQGKLPVSDVLIGPHTTTHIEDGSLTHDGFWSENWVGGPTKSKLSEEVVAAWQKRYDQLNQGIENSPWKTSCKLASVRYFKAFSNPNLEESFLDGWRLFENITGSRYEKVETKLIRASNVCKNSIEYGIIGKHLALRRNSISHGHPIRADDEETLAFQMLQFVLPYLTHFIVNWFSFTSPEEFWEFFDLPAQRSGRSAETVKLRRRLALLIKAAQFRGETDGTS